MERRDVLKAGALGAAATAVAGGCATVPHAETAPIGGPSNGLSGDEFLGLLDRQLGYIGHARFVDEFVTQANGRVRAPAMQQTVSDSDDAFRRMLRTLVITQGFRDLSVETQVEPAVQTRMSSHMEEVDATVFEVADRLAAIDAAQHARVQRALRDQPDLAMQIGEAVDAHAAAAGLSGARRRQLRMMMMQTAFRLKHEAPGTLIGEYTQKVTRMRQEGDRSALALAVSERIGRQAFWAYQKRVAQAPGASPPPVPGPPVPGALPPPQAATNPHPHRYTVLKVGGAMMGVGAVTFGVSALILSSGGSDGFLIGITVGSILFGLGLLFLIVGALIAATAD
ncbi:MAG TPA: hypothetical protein VLM79_24705 [Kofleriaceae bacterium]|nr:hypothetical protein [Kofleriaceae bacterium]